MAKKKAAKKMGREMYCCMECGAGKMKGGMHCGKMMKKR
jgi:hypothetical protein